MVTEKIEKEDQEELDLLDREVREARHQLDQAVSAGNIHESLQSTFSYVCQNDVDDPFLGPVSDDDHSRWIVTYAPTEIEGNGVDAVDTERKSPQTSCCTII